MNWAGRSVARLLLLVVAGLSVQPLAAHQLQERHLRLGIHPYLPEPELIKRFTPLCNYISKRLSTQLVVSVSKSYQAHIERMGNEVLDIAYMGPSSYVSMTRRYGQRPLLARLAVRDTPTFSGLIIVRQDSDVESIRQLSGRRFAFGNPESTMSYLVPRAMLIKAGVPLQSLSMYKFLGNHKNVALSVLLGEYDAGAVKEEVYQQYRDKGLKALAISPRISEHLFVSNRTLPRVQQHKLRQLLLQMADDPEGRAALAAIKKTVTRLLPVRDADYNSLRHLTDL